MKLVLSIFVCAGAILLLLFFAFSPNTVLSYVLGIAAVATLAVVLWRVPIIQVRRYSTAQLKDASIPQLENSFRQTLGQLVGGAVVLLGAVVAMRKYQTDTASATESQDLARRGQIAERFVRAAEHLNSDSAILRLEAIQALDKIGRDSAADYWTTVRLMVSYLQESFPFDMEANPPFESNATEDSWGLPPPWVEPPAEVQAIIDVLGFRDSPPTTGQLQVREGKHLSLKGIDLRGVEFGGAFLRNTSFDDSCLEGARLSGADLTGSYFSSCRLQGTMMLGTNLGAAQLTGVDLRGIPMAGADLRGADLSAAKLLQADLLGTARKSSWFGSRDYETSFGHGEWQSAIVDEATHFGSLKPPPWWPVALEKCRP